jgi:hypothetical protein
LVLLISTIGIGSVLGCAIPYFEPQQTTTHVGEFFTVVAINYGTNCIDPADIEIYEAENCPSILPTKLFLLVPNAMEISLPLHTGQLNKEW